MNDSRQMMIGTTIMVADTMEIGFQMVKEPNLNNREKRVHSLCMKFKETT